MVCDENASKWNAPKWNRAKVGHVKLGHVKLARAKLNAPNWHDTAKSTVDSCANQPSTLKSIADEPV